MENTIEIGLLWLDDDPAKNLEEKIYQVAASHQREFGESANVCYVHPDVLGGNGNSSSPRMIGNVLVRPRQGVRETHFWAGVERE